MKYLVILLLAGCSLTTTVNLKCKGECDLEMNREASVSAPTPTVLSGTSTELK